MVVLFFAKIIISPKKILILLVFFNRLSTLLINRYYDGSLRSLSSLRRGIFVKELLSFLLC